ncbi:dihydroorotate dehydrogenase electron transfer subunit [Acidihalobacter ferrooxydans]|uniref:Dihydroorotate dehydrogenase electron transfer subunit n=1 Tax=Acidihalobacter ferrooxydans TaxID=1765967 RepID=A0A1P8UDV1_9GAMM|nr:dihydroorotate dehydrogenase electron transfer subunit [Acidihalobacter ferrooxydans]APZ41969.1 dihydroorotate dehydrogenase electron transfer subunit [Acidihalobacter ferrooxydans]
MNAKPHRDTIHVEDAKILAHQAYPAEQYVLRVHAPRCAAEAKPGSFAHLTCDPQRPLRRPLSIMRTDPEAGWVEFLYKAVGAGTALLARRRIGETLSLMGPIGKPFELHPERRRAVLLGGGVGIPPMVFLASRLRRLAQYRPFAVLGSEVPFPFTAKPSAIMVPGLPEGVIATMPLLEDWGIAARLTSLQGYAGCHEGYVTDLARHWLQTLPDEEREQVEFFACGPHPMLKAVAALAAEFGLPAQVSLEEFMACAVGGCAGCTVRIATPEGPAMKRVCADGPVFAAESVLF